MILTLTGASGAGKTTIGRGLLNKLPVYAQIVPSYTTRKQKENDIPGEYKYVSKFGFWFLKKIESFLWTVYPHGNSYGTTRRWVIKALKDDNTVYIMILTPDAIIKLENFAKKIGHLDRVFSFYVISPPREVLMERLRSRGDKEDDIERRLADCVRWDSEAMASDIPYEFVKNDSTVESVTKEVIARFLQKIGDCYF